MMIGAGEVHSQIAVTLNLQYLNPQHILRKESMIKHRTLFTALFGIALASGGLQASAASNSDATEGKRLFDQTVSSVTRPMRLANPVLPHRYLTQSY
jgi:hypothetical protein